MVTLEAALSLSALVLVAGAILGAIAMLGAYVSAIDIAGAAARSQAIGVPYEPPRGSIDFHSSGGLVTATARIPVAGVNVSASAVFPEEQAAGR